MVPRLAMNSLSSARLALDALSVLPFRPSSSRLASRDSVSFRCRSLSVSCLVSSSTLTPSTAARLATSSTSSSTVVSSSTAGSASTVSSTGASAAFLARSAAALSSACSVSFASAERFSASIFSSTEFCITACSASVNPSSVASFTTLFTRRVDVDF